MLKLIKLEWKKNNIAKYILNAVITTAVFLIFILAMAGELEAEAPELYGSNTINVSVELFMHMAYMVFTGVMLASFVVGAYEKKTMNLMFSYPIKRQKILLSKIFAVWIFNFAVMVLSKLFIYFVLIMTKSFTNISTVSIRFGALDFWIEILLNSAVMVSISFVALPVGLKMKSSKATIIAAVIVVCCAQGNIGTFTLINNIPFYVSLLMVAIVSVILSIHNVEVKDVL